VIGDHPAAEEIQAAAILLCHLNGCPEIGESLSISVDI
jgi:hypothetical protein